MIESHPRKHVMFEIGRHFVEFRVRFVRSPNQSVVDTLGDVSVLQGMGSTHVFIPLEHISEEPGSMELNPVPIWTKQPRSSWWKCSHARCNFRP